jgi:hypothetical protein
VSSCAETLQLNGTKHVRNAFARRRDRILERIEVVNYIGCTFTGTINNAIPKVHFHLVHPLIIAFGSVILEYPGIQILRDIFHSFLHMIPKTIGNLSTGKMRLENCIDLSDLVMIGENIIEMRNNSEP